MRSDPPDASLAHNAFHYLHLPTPDRQAPTMDQLKQGVEFIKQEVEANGKVYIHCLFGQGRGPTMVMAYLITNGMKVKEALAKIQAIRPFAAPSPEQMKRLKRYRKSLKKGAWFDLSYVIPDRRWRQSCLPAGGLDPGSSELAP